MNKKLFFQIVLFIILIIFTVLVWPSNKIYASSLFSVGSGCLYFISDK